MTDEEQMAAMVRSQALDVAVRTHITGEKTEALLDRAGKIEAFLKGDSAPDAG